MPLDRAVVGRGYRPLDPYGVGRDAIRRFAQAIGESDPACHDVAAATAGGHPDLVAPPTFATVLSLPATERVARDPAVGLDWTRVVHREQRFTHHRPVHAGDVLATFVTVVDAKSVAGNDVLVTRADISTVDGLPVCTATTTLVAR
jgi:acyl dehydratase